MSAPGVEHDQVSSGPHRVALQFSNDIAVDLFDRLRRKIKWSKHVQCNLLEAPPLTRLQPQKKETELKDKKIIKEREKICPEDLVPEALHLCVPLPPFPHGGRWG